MKVSVLEHHAAPPSVAVDSGASPLSSLFKFDTFFSMPLSAWSLKLSIASFNAAIFSFKLCLVASN